MGDRLVHHRPQLFDRVEMEAISWDEVEDDFLPGCSSNSLTNFAWWYLALSSGTRIFVLQIDRAVKVDPLPRDRRRNPPDRVARQPAPAGR